jgi:type VI secretion system secreted protein Hcp
MAIVIPEVTARVGAAQSSSDVFLHVQTRRAGKIKGESTLGGHEEDILLTSWNWGLSAASAIGSTQATGAAPTPR